MQLVAYGGQDVYLGNYHQHQLDYRNGYVFNNNNQHRPARERFFYKYKHNNKGNLSNKKNNTPIQHKHRESGYVYDNYNGYSGYNGYNIRPKPIYQPIPIHQPISIIETSKKKMSVTKITQSKNLPNKIKNTIHWRTLANLGGFIKKKNINNTVLSRYLIKPNTKLHYDKFALVEKIKPIIYNIRSRARMLNNLKKYFNKFINYKIFALSGLFNLLDLKTTSTNQYFFDNINNNIQIKHYIINNFIFDQQTTTFNQSNKNTMKNTECPISTDEITDKYIECQNCLYCYEYNTCKIWLEQKSTCPMCNTYLSDTYKNVTDTYIFDVGLDTSNNSFDDLFDTLNYVKNKIN